MTGYVALLRGINVGKAKRIAMADLRALLEGLGYTHVKTVLNSGNAVFDATGAVAENPLGKVADNPSRYMVVFTQAPAALAELEPLTKRRSPFLRRILRRVDPAPAVLLPPANAVSTAP